MSLFEREPGNDKHIQSYQWIISNLDTLRSIRKAKAHEFFVSPVFKLHGFRWFIKLFPSGISEQGNKGTVDFEVSMEGITPNVSELSANFTIFWNDIGPSEDTKPIIFSTPRIFNGELRKPRVSIQDLQKHLRVIKVRIQIELLNVLDINGNTIDDRSLYPSLKKVKHERKCNGTNLIPTTQNVLSNDDYKQDKFYVSSMEEMRIEIDSLSKRVKALENKMMLKEDAQLPPMMNQKEGDNVPYTCQ